MWGTIATFWVGAITGGIWSIAARSNSESLTWRDLVVPTAVFMSCLLISSIVVGFLEYQKYNNSFNTALSMHNWSYAAAACGAVGMAFYFFYKSKSSKDFIKIEPTGLSLNFTSLIFTD